MASKAKAQTKAAERQERLEQLKRQQAAQERKRNLMVGGVVVLVVAVLAATIFLLTRGGGDDAAASAAGQSEYGVTIGPADAPTQVVIYEDFLCPACGAFEAATRDQLAQAAEEGKVRVDYRPFELLGQYGDYSARSAAAFGVVLQESGPEVAKKFHDLLYENQPEEGASSYPDADALIDLAVEAGADEAAVRPGIEAGENDFSDGATKEAEDAGVQGTPTIFVDGERTQLSPEQLLAEIG
ncbi:DsbA family protein [Nocardioides litoris]|uniref:DsbA family protein n=1 Tax=Nocardioides litoris TaxID=1926648 RepID=UPI00111E041D|nr:thioredoxin domain-containing protein [Nocardioides litoris]